MFTSKLDVLFFRTIKDFGQVGRVALQMTAERRGITLAEEERTRILGSIRRLPPHPDVRDALERLCQTGCAAALGARPGMAADPLLDTPDIVGKDLREVAERIIEIERR